MYTYLFVHYPRPEVKLLPWPPAPLQLDPNGAECPTGSHTPTGSNIIAQGQRSGAAAKRHPGLRGREKTSTPKGVALSE